MSAWNYGDDVVLQVAGKYSLTGKIVGKPTEDGRVTVRWEDRTMTQLRGDLLVTPSEAAAAPADTETAALLAERDELLEVVAGADHTAAKYWRRMAETRVERDRARGIAVKLEQQLGEIERIVTPPLVRYGSPLRRVFEIRDILGVRPQR